MNIERLNRIVVVGGAENHRGRASRSEPRLRCHDCHIAKGAEVPIVMAQVDGKKKSICILKEPFYPTDDIEADMAVIKGKFEGVVGINPRRKYITLQS